MQNIKYLTRKKNKRWERKKLTAGQRLIGLMPLQCDEFKWHLHTTVDIKFSRNNCESSLKKLYFTFHHKKHDYLQHNPANVHVCDTLTVETKDVLLITLGTNAMPVEASHMFTNSLLYIDSTNMSGLQVWSMWVLLAARSWKCRNRSYKRIQLVFKLSHQKNIQIHLGNTKNKDFSVFNHDFSRVMSRFPEVGIKQEDRWMTACNAGETRGRQWAEGLRCCEQNCPSICHTL